MDDRAGAIGRARDAGAFVIMLHPGLNNLPLAAAGGLPALGAVQLVEVYNRNNAMAGSPDRTHGTYMLDGLLERGYRVLVNAGDDAHFRHPAHRFGGWVEVHCEQLDPETLLDALKAGRYYWTLRLPAAAIGAGREGSHEPARRLDLRGGFRPERISRVVLPHHRRRSSRPASLE